MPKREFSNLKGGNGGTGAVAMRVFPSLPAVLHCEAEKNINSVIKQNK
jgi:hypothetical protein